MPAPSSTVWGAIVTGNKSTHKGRIGINIALETVSDTQTKATVQVWFWSMYSINDTENSYYYNADATTATKLIGSVSIKHTVASGSGWSTKNQTKLGESSYTYTRGTSARTINYAAKLVGIDSADAGKGMTVTTSFKLLGLAKYTITYNANGGIGAPSSQTKYYSLDTNISTNKPSRTGYIFQGWATSSDGKVAYAAGAKYENNASITLYAVWKAITYQVIYNANGGSGAPSVQLKTHDKTLTLSMITPTRANYIFKGWSTVASSGTVSYHPNGSYTNNAAITLYAVWELAYTKPRIKNLSVNRCNAEGQFQDDGAYASVVFDWEIDENQDSRARIDIGWFYGANEDGLIDSTAWREANGVYSGHVEQVIGDGVLSTDSSYDILISVMDSHGSTIINRLLNGLEFTIDGLAGGKGVAFGKPAELEGYADFAYKLLMKNNTAIFARDELGLIKEAFNPVNANGNTVLGWGNYDTKDGNTNIYGHDVNIGVSNIANPGTYRPYKRQGDTVTFTIRTAGYVTNAGKDVTFLVPFAVPIIGAPTATAASVQGLVLRQDTAYTHGSASDTFVTPDSYSASVSMFCGVYITAHFSDTTNVVNNSAIGVYWNGTITFS